jgi:hypothetical protein
MIGDRKQAPEIYSQAYKRPAIPAHQSTLQDSMEAFVQQNPLPPIETDAFRRQVFTHKSVHGLPVGLVYEEEAGVDNERFELCMYLAT